MNQRKREEERPERLSMKKREGEGWERGKRWKSGLPVDGDGLLYSREEVQETIFTPIP